MRFDDYQKKSRETAIYPKITRGFIYPTMGLAGETGEFLNKIKKIFRDDKGRLTIQKKKELSEELGGVLWYLAQVATELDLSLKDIAKDNLKILASRKKRGVLNGSGDRR